MTQPYREAPADGPDESPAEAFFRRGWLAFEPDPVTRRWVDRAAPVARSLAEDPALIDAWLRCGGTWFAGVNVFPNAADGSVAGRGVPALAGPAVAFVRAALGFERFAWDNAQISVCYPGYPAAASEDESEAAFRFRRERDAAHVDGLLRDDARRRSVGEVHGFILGIPLSSAPPDAAPMVVWERSHEVMRAAFRARLGALPASEWSAEDITDAYTAARREVFERCRRVRIQVPLGGSYLVHRLALHGVAPWGENGGAAPRPIAYFRPNPFPGTAPRWWLDRP